MLLVVCLSACKSNTKLNRGMKAMTTKYNTYFNGNEAFKDGLDAMENKHDEEFGQRIKLHPVYELTDAKEPPANAQFDRAIEKCKIAVQRKSMPNKPKRRGKNTPEYKLWLTHGEFNPFLHNAWILSGKAQFYKGDFNAAAATFSYTARRFCTPHVASGGANIPLPNVTSGQHASMPCRASTSMPKPNLAWSFLQSNTPTKRN